MKRLVALFTIIMLFTWVGIVAAESTVGDNSANHPIVKAGDEINITQVPEPATLLFFGVGLVVFAVLCRKRTFVSNGIKHTFNPLHIYCRLRDIGISKGFAASFCIFYEKSIFKHFLTNID